MAAITIVTDAWHPQVNGVVRSIERTNIELEKLGHRVTMLTPQLFATVPCPTYPEIRLSIARPARIFSVLDSSRPSYVHVATEGPLGLMTRHWCMENRVRFTTSYHTRFPEYVSARLPVPQRALYAMMRWFHNSGRGCMVATKSLENDLGARGFRNLMRWSRGIDAHLFGPCAALSLDLPRPVFMNVGRVSVEKNLEAFLALDLPGSKVVVGGGPALGPLAAKYPEVVFTGPKIGEELAGLYAAADVFVFPSRTDTFGNVILEALASGVPVAAYPVMGPIDILGDHPEAGALSDDLRQAALAALECSREAARALALSYSWEASARQFYDNMRIANGEDGAV